jgi:hypothetical protein
MKSFPLEIDAAENVHVLLKSVGLYDCLLIKRLDALDGTSEFNLIRESINRLTTKSNM